VVVPYPGSFNVPTPLLIPSDRRILYFHRDHEAFGFLSHFHPSPIELDGESWPTVEHYFQCHKSLDSDYRRAIREASTPAEAKRLANFWTRPGTPPARILTKSWFHRNNATPRADWLEVKRDVMRRADLAKFLQNPDLCESLRSTEDAELIEDSPFEPFWGIGPDGTGQNWVGRIVMEVRDTLLRLSSSTPEGQSSQVASPTNLS
jgi:N-glycosidase YbiA